MTGFEKQLIKEALVQMTINKKVNTGKQVVQLLRKINNYALK